MKKFRVSGLLTLCTLAILSLPAPAAAQIKVLTFNTGQSWMNEIVNKLPGLSITQADSTTIPTIDFTQFDVIYVSDVWTGGGTTPAWAAALNARQADIESYVKNGGGLVFGVQNYGNQTAIGTEYGFVPPGLVTAPPVGTQLYGNAITITVQLYPIFVGVTSASLSNWSSSYHSSFPGGSLPAVATGSGTGGTAITYRAGSYGNGKVVGWTQDPDYHNQAGGDLMVANAVNWAAKGPRWISLSPSGTAPSARADASAIYVRNGNQMILFGGNAVGCTADPSLNDTWSLTAANDLGAGSAAWHLITPAGSAPPGRRGHSAVYNAKSDSMIVFGGDQEGCSSNKLNDVWVLTGASGSASAWTQLSPAGGPPAARSDQVAAYYQSSNSLLIFGGTGTGGSLNDLWLLSNADGTTGTPTWTQLTPSGSGPADTSYMAGTIDPGHDVLTLFGGWACCSGPSSNQVWMLTNASGAGGTPTWTLATPNGTAPSARFGVSASYRASTSNNAVYFGGSGLNDTWVLYNANGIGGTPAWGQLTPGGVAPPGRGGQTGNAASAYDPFSYRGIIFGGMGSSGLLNDVWVLAR